MVKRPLVSSMDKKTLKFFFDKKTLLPFFGKKHLQSLIKGRIPLELLWALLWRRTSNFSMTKTFKHWPNRIRILYGYADPLIKKAAPRPIYAVELQTFLWRRPLNMSMKEKFSGSNVKKIFCLSNNKVFNSSKGAKCWGVNLLINQRTVWVYPPSWRIFCFILLKWFDIFPSSLYLF